MAALLLAACGGGDTDEPVATAAADGALFDDRGQPAAAARERPPGAPATRSGLYASVEQLQWETLTVQPYTVLIDLDDGVAPADALRTTLADRAWRGGAKGYAYFVRGASPDAAAAMADALTDAGVAPVFLVVGGA